MHRVYQVMVDVRRAKATNCTAHGCVTVVLLRKIPMTESTLPTNGLGNATQDKVQSTHPASHISSVSDVSYLCNLSH